MSKKEYIKEIFIYRDENNNIFNSYKPYQIPLYQRAFAWEDRQLVQLLEDIRDCENDNYYLGSLIVSDRGGFYEVVDGQQRLTALFLLLSYLKKPIKRNLRFACRDKSNYTLDNIQEFLNPTISKEYEKIEDSIVNGLKILEEELHDPLKYGKDFSEKLSKVVMYRIEVPPYTNLNRYFETMNTRGEQLEQHDVLKAKLMNFYDSEDVEGQNAFATIWDACRDMSGYVQMHFSTKNRDTLFGDLWEDLPTKEKIESFSSNVTGKDPKNIKSIISPEYSPEEFKALYDGKELNVRFESIIDFPYFLLHCLRSYVSINDLKSDDGEKLCESLLNDKKLVQSFTRVIEHALMNDEHIEKNSFVQDFCFHLLNTRVLFDRYILKREYIGDSLDGEWSLKTLKVSESGDRRKPYFSNTFFSSTDSHKSNLMIQAALRVSYTSPKVMHWITYLLAWISGKDNLSRLNEFRSEAEGIAKRSIRESFFDICQDGNYQLGVSTPHLVFNFLDYCLWCCEPNKYPDFTFEFRNSVEHWYPRNPLEEELTKWDDVDRFGNLCLIQRNVNSKFSNLPPEGKKVAYSQMIDKGSIKLRLMREKTAPEGNISGSVIWKERKCEEHEKEMIKILKEACGVE